MNHVKKYSYFSFAVLLYLVLQNIVSALLGKLQPAFFGSGLGAELRYNLPIYLVAFPIFLLMVRKIPAEPRRIDYLTHPLTLGEYLKYFLILRGILLVSTLIHVVLFPSFMTGLVDYSAEGTDTLGVRLFGTFIAVVAAPVVEEIITRKLPFEKLGNGHDARLIVYTAIVFGLMHLNSLQAINAFFIGLVLGIVLFKTGGIKATIILHSLYNASLQLTSYLDYFELGQTASFISGTVVSVIGVFVLLFAGIKALKNRTLLLPSLTDLRISLVNPGSLLFVGAALFLIIRSLVDWV